MYFFLRTDELEVFREFILSSKDKALEVTECEIHFTFFNNF